MNSLTDYAKFRLDQIRRQAKGTMTMTDNYDEVMNRLNMTKPVVDRDPFIGAGQHDSLIVLSIDTYQDQKWGQTVRGTFLVEKSTFHAPGTTVCKLWNLFKPAKFATQNTDADGFADFCCKLTGAPEGGHHAIARSLIKSRAEGGNKEAQPGRGARIIATGREAGKPNERGQRYVVVSWQTFAGQTNEMMAQTRAQLDATRPYTPNNSAPVPQPPQMMPQAPAPMQYQAPVQPQMQYQQPPQTPAPMQYQAPAPYQAAPQYQAPVQPVAQPTQVQTAPIGGFLSLLPK
jgi:hypothetical protein